MRSLIRPAARWMLVGIFVDSGYRMLQNPDRYAKQAAGAIPGFPEDPNIAKAYGATMLTAGTTLALGILPRLSAGVLALTLIPNTYIGHPFWKADDAARRGQLIHFLKNAGLMGGLLTVVTAEKPRPG